MYRKRVDGTGSAERVVAPGSVPRIPYGVSSDGSLLFVGELTGSGPDIALVSLSGDSEPRPLINRRFAEVNATLSPDGRWIAYQSDESGRFEVYVRPFPDLDGQWQISVEGGGVPVWGPDGKELFYAKGSGAMMTVPIIETEPTFVLGAPEVLFEGVFVLGGSGLRDYDVSPDGERFLVLKAVEETRDPAERDRIVIVENWFEELKHLVPTD